MKKNVEYIDFNASKWLVGTSKMTPEQKGAYWTICALIYANQERPDEDYSYLARHFGCSSRKARSLVAALVALGKIQIIDGKIAQNKSENELNKAQKRIEDSSKGGRTKAENEAKRRLNNDLTSTPQPDIEASITTTTTTNKDNPPNPLGVDDDADFQTFFAVFPATKRGSEDMALKAWHKARKMADAARIIAGARAYAATDEVKNGFCTWPAVWLKNGGWLNHGAQTLAPPPELDVSTLQEWQIQARDLFGEAVFRSWFAKCSFENGVLHAPTRFVRDWIETNYWPRLKALCWPTGAVLGVREYA